MSKLGSLSEESSEDTVKAGSSLTREELLSCLRSVLDISFKKINYINTTVEQRAMLSRIVVNACGVAGSILEDKDLDDLRQRIKVLERSMNIK